MATTLMSVPPSTCRHLLKLEGFHHTQFAVPLSERRRTFSGSSCRFRDPLQYSCIRKINIKAATNNSENNKNKVITGKKYELVPRYSKDQHVPRGEFTKFMIALYEFSRPYTMIGTIISVPAISLLPLRSVAEVSPAFLVGVLQAMIIYLLCQVFVSGLNQIYDVEIDKVNKPYLPLASGIFSMEFALALVTMSLVGSLAMGIMFHSPPLLVGALILCFLGSLYSMELPFMRWKTNQFLAITCIAMARAIIIPLGTFLHIQKYVLGRPILFPISLIFASCSMTLFSIVVALSKDIPDIEGDRLFGSDLLTIRLGQDRVFIICISILMVICGIGMGIGATSSFLLTKLVTVLGNFILACVLLHRALTIDLSVEGSNFYMFVWKLIYAAYLLIPFVR